MNVLAVGDVVGRPGLDRISRSLRWWKKQLNADFVVVNGENASVVGMTPDQGEEIFDAGADVITMGNHTFKKREIVPYLEDNSRVLRPANLAPQLPGSGVGVYETKFGPVAVIDLIGRCNMDYHAENPFLMVDKLRTQLDTKLILVELHAEATSEKLAMGYYLDGKVSAVLGTHTHVPTADTTILPKGTAYQTDVGMVGPVESVLGMKVENSINRFVTQRRVKYQQSEDEHFLFQAVLLELDGDGKAVHIERIEERMTIERTTV